MKFLKIILIYSFIFRSLSLFNIKIISCFSGSEISCKENALRLGDWLTVPQLEEPGSKALLLLDVFIINFLFTLIFGEYNVSSHLRKAYIKWDFLVFSEEKKSEDFFLSNGKIKNLLLK